MPQTPIGSQDDFYWFGFGPVRGGGVAQVVTAVGR